MYTTRKDAEAAVIEAIENGDANAEDFDIAGIAGEAYEYSPELQQFVQVVDTEGFWAIVERWAR